MLRKCEYCGNNFEDTIANCPHCGSNNKYVRRTTNDTPKTIEELLDWCNARNLHLLSMRFFIGQDYKGPKAYGIYKNPTTGIVTVYKNKGDGTRAVRYEGTDEAYAVNEIFIKLKEEIIHHKQLTCTADPHNYSKKNYDTYNRTYTKPVSSNSSKGGGFIEGIFGVIGSIFHRRPVLYIILILYVMARGSSCMGISSSSYNGYSYNGSTYSGSSYYYDGSSSYDNDSGYSWDWDWGSDSSDSYDYDWDSGWDSYDYDWDSGWDSSDWGSDWDSDW